MDDIEALRPRGTVQVSCDHPGCGLAWWVDPLDPLLKDPNHKWDCGDNHRATATVRRRLSLVKLRTGYQWGTMVATGPELPNARPCCNRSSESGHALLYDRERDKVGSISWSHPDDLKNHLEVVSKIEWDKSKWPADLLSGPYSPQEELPEGYVSWVGYQVQGGKTRRYTFVKCCREGCPQRVMVDYDDPDFKAHSYSIGSWGGGDLREPFWWGTREFKCEEGLSAFGPQPCEIVHGARLAALETNGDRWTMWWSNGEIGTILFYNEERNLYGILGLGREPAETSMRILGGIKWGTLIAVEEALSFVREDENAHDEVLYELRNHVRLPS